MEKDFLTGDPQPPSAPLHREQDSLDDFEHLGHDASPLNDRARAEPPINTPDSAANPSPVTKMDSNLLEMGDSLLHQDPDDKLDRFLQDFAQPPKHQEPPEFFDKDDKVNVSQTQDFLQHEAEKEVLEKYSDSDNDDDFKPSKFEDFPKKELPESVSAEFRADAFKDLEELQPDPPRKDYPLEPQVVEKKPEPEPEVCKKPEKEQDVKAKKGAVIDAEAIFCKMGLDTWFNPERLNPKVESLIYWRDPKKSGPVFGGVLVVLLALTYFSLISVVAYLSLLGLTGTISFRIYKNIVQAVQKTGDGHPFKDLLELNVALPQEKVKEVSEVAVAHINAAVVELRRLFLVEDLVDSIKFGVLLWTLTYLGAWFNGMTLIIIGWVALFTLPKVYEANKAQIDANLEIVRTKLAEITSKVKAAIPIGKKAEEKKEQ